MATKYCDHGAYANSANFVCSTGSNNSTLTVTSVTSGKLTIGARLIGLAPYFPMEPFIASYGTGSGGVGTYNLSIQSNQAAVTGLSVTSENGCPSIIPTWGECQDGDGTAKTAATPSAAEIVFTGVPSSGSIYVMGVVVTATWATSADNCANLLATAINALTTTAVGPASFTTKSQVRNHLYARGPALGAPAGTCEVMTRQGSASHAGLVAFTHTLNNVSSAGTVNFTGGTGGVLGWVLNTGTMWPSNISQLSYGLFASISGYTVSIAGGDEVKVRSGKTVYTYSWMNGSLYYYTLPVMGTAMSPVTFTIDDGTEWPEDGIEPVLEIRMVCNYGQYNKFFDVRNGFLLVNAKRYSDTKYGLVLSATGIQGYEQITLGLLASSYCKLIGVEFKNYSGGGSFQIYRASIGASGTRGLIMEACRVTMFNGSYYPILSVGGTSTSTYVKMVDCLIDAGSPSAKPMYVIEVVYNIYQQYRVVFDSVRFINFLIGTVLHASHVGTAATSASLIFRNCDFGNITVMGPFCGQMVVAYPKDHRALEHGIQSSTQLHPGNFTLDTPQGYVAWVYNRSFPTLNAKLRDGVTPWSMQVVPTQVSTNVCRINPFETPRFIRINSLPTAIRTFRICFGAEQSLAITKADVSILIEYQDAGGVVRTVSSFDVLGAALTANNEPWTNPSGSQFIYSDAGDIYMNKYELSVTTPTPVKGIDAEGELGTEVGCIFGVHFSVTDATKMLFIDPEILMT